MRGMIEYADTQNSTDTPPPPGALPEGTCPRWRMGWWLAASVLLALLIAAIAPQQLPVSIYKLSLVTAAAVAGYWIDRSIFPYARPNPYTAGEQPLQFAAAQVRRALIVAAAMLAMGLGA